VDYGPVRQTEPRENEHVRVHTRRASAGKTGVSAVSWETLLTTTLVPVASVLSTATVAVWTKRIDAKTKREDRDHALVLDYEKRAGDDKKAVAEAPHLRDPLPQARGRTTRGAEITEESTSRRRAAATRELYEFRDGWVSTTESPS